MQEICPLSLNKLLNDIFQGFFAVTPLSGSNHLPYRPFSTFQAYFNFSSPDFTVPKITPDSQNFDEGYLRIFRNCGRVRFGAAYEHKYEYKIPSLCVVFGCSNTPDPKSGIILHKILCDGNSRPEAIKRVKRWVDFVKRKHAKLEPSSSSWIYSKHLEAGRICSPSKFAGANLHSVAKKDVSSFPTLFAASEGDQEMTKRTARTLQHKVRLLRQTIYKAKLHI